MGTVWKRTIQAFVKNEGRYDSTPHKDSTLTNNVDIDPYQIYKTQWLCKQLSQIGIKVTAMSRGPFSLESKFYRSVTYAKVEFGNIDLIELEEIYYPGNGLELTGDFTNFMLYYVVMVNVEGFGDTLKSYGKAVKKDFFSRQKIDFKWKGGELAKILNDDAKLRDQLLSQSRVINIEITPSRIDNCVRIGPLSICNSLVPELLPTTEAFNAYDRIALHIRNIASTRSSMRTP